MRSGIVICFAILALACSQLANAKESIVIAPSVYQALTKPVPNIGIANVSASRKDTIGSCQVGARKHGSPIKGTVGQGVRKASVVACESPPRSHVNLAGVSAVSAATQLASG
jgi:hypothetical protein